MSISSSLIGQFQIGISPIQGIPALPPAPVTIQKTIPAYLYVEYNDDDNVQAFIDAYNALTQSYLDWFNTINLPVYTSPTIIGALLDWVAQGLYGYARPVLSSGTSRIRGPLNTFAFNTLPFNGRKNIVSSTITVTTDDIFKRCLTWNFYKGDGKTCSVAWLKRRVMRFLTGVNGTAGTFDNTYPISVGFTSSTQVTISIIDPGNYDANVLSALSEGIASGTLQTPFQFQFNVVDASGSGFGYFAFGVTAF